MVANCEESNFLFGEIGKNYPCFVVYGKTIPPGKSPMQIVNFEVLVVAFVFQQLY